MILGTLFDTVEFSVLVGVAEGVVVLVGAVCDLTGRLLSRSKRRLLIYFNEIQTLLIYKHTHVYTDRVKAAHKIIFIPRQLLALSAELQGLRRLLHSFCGSTVVNF